MDHGSTDWDEIVGWIVDIEVWTLHRCAWGIREEKSLNKNRCFPPANWLVVEEQGIPCAPSLRNSGFLVICNNFPENEWLEPPKNHQNFGGFADVSPSPYRSDKNELHGAGAPGWQRTPTLAPINHGSVENYPKWKEAFILEIHPFSTSTSYGRKGISSDVGFFFSPHLKLIYI